MTIGDMEKVRGALDSFREMAQNKADFIEKQTNGGEEDPEDYSGYDEAVTDYNYELAYLGELLADALAEALGIEEKK
ncbi:hypothetical protein ANNAL29_82 [Mycobacterium phage AnnaL29]|uniref:hypothetical protein n=1 Tax=Mycobacterium phage AnnaL29 TaxID=1076630 RepID=UPI00024DEB43|nr:hypothetical protein O153_gp25 [Mycobacterium phage AnnaL29]AGS82763.1 hypothetical protein ANNAL29_82 [Mycobacterium phage AnnaL29]